MKKIILGLLILNSLTFAGIFGDTDEEREIAQKRMIKTVLGGGDKTLKIRKENYDIKKILKKHHINYEYPLKIMRNKENIKPIINKFIITEEIEMKILEKENKELKRLMEANYIKKEKSRTADPKPAERSAMILRAKEDINTKEKERLKRELEKAIEEVE